VTDAAFRPDDGAETPDDAMRSRAIVRAASVLVVTLGLVPLGRFLSHTSQEPEVLGRYSRGYALLVLAYLTGVGIAAALTWATFRSSDRRLGEVFGAVRKLRRRPTVLTAAILLPWLLLIVTFEALDQAVPFRSAAFQYAVAGIAVVVNLLTMLVGQSRVGFIEAVARMLLLGLSLGAGVGAVEFLLRRSPGLIPNSARPHLAGEGRFLRRDLVFDKPLRVGFHYRPMLSASFSYRQSQGDLYSRERGDIRPLATEEDADLAQVDFVTDENGYANRPPLQPRYDLAISGDSFSVPGTVAKPWPQLLGERLGRSVLNLAMPAYSFQAEVEAIKMYGLVRKPSWVVVGFFEGNDLVVESVGYDEKRSSGLSWVEHDLATEGPYRSFVTLLSIRYGLPNLVSRLLQRFGLSGSRRSEDYRYPLVASVGGHRLPLAFYDLYLSVLTARRQDIEASKNLALVEAALVDLKRSTEASGARLLLVYIPTKGHVYLPAFDDDRDRSTALQDISAVMLDPHGYLVLGPASADRTALFRMHAGSQRDAMSALAARHGVHFFDLTPGLQAEARRGQALYYTADTHWNQAGHQRAAELVADHLSRAALESHTP
jgi:hypothetical protein